MAILKIARMGHPVLSRPAAPVPDPTAAEIRRLIADMLDTLEDAGGIGLAAPQVHVPLRVVVFFVPATRAGDGEAVPLTVLVNPEVEAIGEDKEVAYEGCLSVPGLTGPVPRFRAVRYSGWTQAGERVAREAHGFHARVVQHETDHLDGILYPMRMTDLSKLAFVEELSRSRDPAAAEAAAAASD
ncbi:MAG: peptide deformylase [Rhodospirillaceae bacterium]|nr:peptide deformylase [Rhodospirillaceae bacterium]